MARRKPPPGRPLTYDNRFVEGFHLPPWREPLPDEFPFNMPIVRDLLRIDFHPQITFFVGENGSGKSTVLEALAEMVGLNPEGGSKNYAFATRESHSNLGDRFLLRRGADREETAFFLRAESFYNVATETERLGYEHMFGSRKLHEQSHGELFMAMAENRIWPNSLVLFDEPEAALSPMRQLDWLALVHQHLNVNGCQMVVATHSPILLAYPNARIYEFSSSGIREIAYEDTDHYRVTLEFLKNYPRQIRRLLGDMSNGNAS